MKKKSSPILMLAIAIALVCWQQWKTPKSNEETQQAQTTRSSTNSSTASPTAPSQDAETAIHYEIPRYEAGTATTEQILKRTAYTASYNQKTRNPNWVGWVLTAEHTDGPYERKGIKFE